MPHIRKVDKGNMMPIKWDLRFGGQIIRTVYFDNMEFDIDGRRYLITETRCVSDKSSKDYGDCVHILKNMDTNERRTVAGVAIRQWIENTKT